LRLRRTIFGVLTALALGGGASATAAGGSGCAATPAHPKRGVASAVLLAHDPRALRCLGAAWAYDWSANPPPAEGGRSATRGHWTPEWVPMLWGAGSVTPSTISTLSAARRVGAARYLLGFNEPDQRAQADLTPERAAALWPQLQRTGLILGSPAPAVPDDGWLARFLAITRARHLRVDFIALHFYQDFTSPQAVRSLRAQLIHLHREFRKPLWITEIGALDTRAWGEGMAAAPSSARAAAYVRRLFAMLDGLPFVRRYAWFTDRCAPASGCYGSLLTAGARRTAVGAAFLGAP
jgi:hypothetical protein